MTDWLKQYLFIVLRIGKAVEARTQDVLYDYYGDKQLEEQVAAEEVHSGEELLSGVSALLDALPHQGFEAHREMYLLKTLTALETVCRRLCGERLSIKEEAQHYFNLQVEWIPESVFEEALAIYEKVLPVKGSIGERLKQHRELYELPKDKSNMLPELMRYAVKEIRVRTNQVIELPQNDYIEIQPIKDKPVKAMAQYFGNYRSAIMVNTDLPFYMPELLSVVSHEGYPGHIAEIVLKEEYLIKRKGYLEQQVGFLLTPSYVISEGIALLAMKSMFAPGEAENWMAENVYPRLGIVEDKVDLLAVQKATDLLRGAWCNAAILLDEGRPVSEAVKYIMRYTQCDEKRAQYAVRSLQRPFCESYIFTYYYGRKLLEPMLNTSQRKENLRRLLTEQVMLSDIIGEGDNCGKQA